MSRQPDRGAGVMALGLIPCLLQLTTPVVAAEFPFAADGKAIGALAFYDTRPSDTLMDVARSYDLGFTQLMAANRGINPWMPPIGARIKLPNVYLLPNVPRQGIVIDLAAQRLYYFPPGKSTVESYPIGIGVIGATTPVGTSRVTAKVANPVWYPPPSIRAERPELPQSIPPGPDNPLGAYALRLGWPAYLIHGTHKPDGVGRNVSHGCIRLYPEDIERLFQEVAVGTEVRVVNDDVKVAWVGDQLYVEAHPNKEQSDELDIEGTLTPTAPPADLQMRVTAAAGNQIRRIDWSIVRRVVTERTGIPTRVTLPSGSQSSS
jgi:L,D-transpeptidase ErfK/SrfK